MRRDAWWLELLPVIALLGAFGVYALRVPSKGHTTNGGRIFLRFIRLSLTPIIAGGRSLRRS